MFFRRKQTFDDAARLKFATAIASSLRVQVMVGAELGGSFEDQNGHPKRKAIGYILGYIEAALQRIGQDTNDITAVAPIICEVLRNLWPENARRYVEFFVDLLGKDEQLFAGMQHGGQQQMAWHRGELAAPAGLARFMCEDDGEKKDTNAAQGSN